MVLPAPPVAVDLIAAAAADGGCELIGSISSLPLLVIPSSLSCFTTGFSVLSDGIWTRSLGRLLFPFGLSIFGDGILGDPGPSLNEGVRLEGIGVPPPLCGGTGEIIR